MWNRATLVTPLDEDSGSTANDYSGNELHGTAGGGAGPSGTGTSSGPLETTAWDFDGTDDEVDLGSDSQDTLAHFVNNHMGSVLCWAKIADNTNNYHFIGVGPQKPGNSAWFLDYNSGVRFGLSNGDGSWNVVAGGYGTMENNTWHLIGATADGSTARVYLDGVEVGSDSIASGTASSLSANVHLGRKSNDTGELNGSLSNVYVFDRASTPQEVVWFNEISQRGKYRGPEITL